VGNRGFSPYSYSQLREPDKIALKISRKLTSRDRDLGGEKGTKKAGACSKVEILS
jgi:hypothetical protein